MHTLRSGGRTNLSEWVENIVDIFCEEQAIDERVSYANIKDRFHYDFQKIFLCTVLNLFFKILIDKGVAHIVEPRPLLVEPRSDKDKKWISQWKQFVEEHQWKKFIDWWTPSLTESKSGRWCGGVVNPYGRNDYIKDPLVDRSLKEIPEKRPNEVPTWYLETWKREKTEEATRNTWTYKFVKNKKKNETTSPDQTKNPSRVNGKATKGKGWGFVRDIDERSKRPTWVDGKVTKGKGWGLIQFFYGRDGSNRINDVGEYVEHDKPRTCNCHNK